MPQPCPPHPMTAAHPRVDPPVDPPFPASGAVPAAAPMPVSASPASVAAPAVAVPYGAGSAGVDGAELTLHRGSQCTSGQESTSAAATHGPAIAEAKQDPQICPMPRKPTQEHWTIVKVCATCKDVALFQMPQTQLDFCRTLHQINT